MTQTTITNSQTQNGSPKWTVGITTAPRAKHEYLSKTVLALKKSGWDNIVVFAEPGSPVSYEYCVVHRRKNYGDWTNWATGFYELLLSEPDTDYFFMLEDDCLVCSGLKKYLELTIPMLGDFATVSPYCPRIYQSHITGYHNKCVGWKTVSTVATIMTRAAAIHFFADSDVQRHRFQHIFPVEAEAINWGVQVDPRNSVKDAVIGLWAYKNLLPMFYHSPSLVQHIGEISTLGDIPMNEDREACDFVGEDYIPCWNDIQIIRNSRSTLKI